MAMSRSSDVSGWAREHGERPRVSVAAVGGELERAGAEQGCLSGNAARLGQLDREARAAPASSAGGGRHDEGRHGTAAGGRLGRGQLVEQVLEGQIAKVSGHLGRILTPSATLLALQPLPELLEKPLVGLVPLLREG